MEQNMDIGFEDFFGGFEGDEYHADTDDVTTDTETTDETAAEDTIEEAEQEAEEASTEDETSEEENSHEADKDVSDEDSEADKAIEKRSFDNLKVNGEIRSCTYEEAPAWIQKGMDYDRVKNQLETEKQRSADLQAEMEKNRDNLELLEQAAEASKMDIKGLLHHVRVGLLMGNGLSEKEANAEIRAQDAERKVKATEQKEAPAKESAATDGKDDRAKREVNDFMRDFPGVKLSDEEVAAMRPYVQKGMSMSTAYLMVKNAKIEADAKKQAEEAAAAAAAKEKNKKNRAKAPGSQNDSGGQRGKDSFDDFFGAFEK